MTQKDRTLESSGWRPLMRFDNGEAQQGLIENDFLEVQRSSYHVGTS